MCGIIPNFRHRAGLIPHRSAKLLLTAVALFLVPGLIWASDAPVITGFAADPQQVKPGEVVNLTVEAYDPNCGESVTCTSGCGLTVRADITSWTATDGSFANENDGTTGSPYTASAEWEAPTAEGTYTISVFLGDSGNFMCGGRGTTTTNLDVQVTTVISDPPVIETLAAFPSQLFPAQNSELTCIATDPEGEPIIYSWESDFGAVVGSPDGTAVFSSGAPGTGSVTCTATDAAGVASSDSIGISVTDARPDTILDRGIVTPQRVDVDSMGVVYVVDSSVGGILALNLFDGEPLYRLEMPGVTSVAVDWADNLVVGDRRGARVVDRAGATLLELSDATSPGRVTDVAVDLSNQRYGVLHGRASRVQVYDGGGILIGGFGSNGDGADQFKSPRGLAAMPDGTWVVADSNHGMIKTFDIGGNLVNSFGGLGGGPDEFVRLDDVAVNAAGVIFASDSYQAWVKSFNPDGSVREVLGTYGRELGEFVTPTGLAPVNGFHRLIISSLNDSNLQVFTTSAAPVTNQPNANPVLSASQVDFAPQVVGSSSAIEAVVLSNTGTAPLGIQQIQIAGGSFSQQNNCGLFLDPGASCSLDVQYSPQQEGSSTGALNIDSSVGGNMVVALSGDAYFPASINITPNPIIFADQEVGFVSDPIDAVLTNEGGIAIEMAGMQLAGDFTMVTNCGWVVEPGGQCNLSISFAPTVVGEQIPGSLKVLGNAVNAPYLLNMSGNAIPALPRIEVGDITVAEGDDDTGELLVPVSLTIPGDSEISVEYAAVSDTAVEDEDFGATSGAMSFSPGETQTTVAVPLYGDRILEPLEKTFSFELANPVNAKLGRSVAVATIVDDEICPSANQPANAGAEGVFLDGNFKGWTQVKDREWVNGRVSPKPQKGTYYFAAKDARYSQIYQDVDVSKWADRIDGEGQLFGFGVFARTHKEGLRTAARLKVEFRDESNTTVLDSLDSGKVRSRRRWKEISDSMTAPEGTRWIRLRLISKSNDVVEGKAAMFDSVQLRSERTPILGVTASGGYEGDYGLSEIAVGVDLNCAYYQEVGVDVATQDGSAIVDQDYLAASAGLSYLMGDTRGELVVPVIGDEEDEGDEAFYVRLSGVSGDALVLKRRRAVWILNDDFCPQPASYWADQIASEGARALPVESVEVGNVTFAGDDLYDLLNSVTSSARRVLQKQIAVAKLNLAAGTDPMILAHVEEADAFMRAHPIGSPLTAEQNLETRRLSGALADALAAVCGTAGVLFW